jgi:hypothetical protein
MYLHEIGEDAASFTKEEMSQGFVFFLTITIQHILI